MSRDLFEVNDKRSNFYMIGSMGLASSIGLGIALKNPKKRVYVFDGDGNILMNLGSMITIGSLSPKNLVHVVFDNNSHESTGGQPTSSSKINLEKVANSVNYKIFVIKSKTKLISVLDQIKRLDEPIFLLIKVSTSKERSKRVSWKPKDIKDRVISSI
jgi:phosphonopyruvate decarboxylase/sulfopyruvate decarboxylase subunit beta